MHEHLLNHITQKRKKSCPSSDATPPAVLPTLVYTLSCKFEVGLIYSTLRNLTRILICILMILLGELLVLLILIEVLTNQELGTYKACQLLQRSQTEARKGNTEFANSVSK